MYFLVTFNLLFAVGASQRNSYNLQSLQADNKLYLFQGIPHSHTTPIRIPWSMGRLCEGSPQKSPNLFTQFWIDIPECKFQHPAAICHPRSTWSGAFIIRGSETRHDVKAWGILDRVLGFIHAVLKRDDVWWKKECGSYLKKNNFQINDVKS